jgi:hypothetical protein
MSTHLFRIALVFCTLLLFFPASIARPPAQPANFDAVRRGMIPEEVRPLVGQPQQLSRQILLRRHLEQWQFDEPAAYIEWNCQRGELPYVIHIQKLKEE